MGKESASEPKNDHKEGAAKKKAKVRGAYRYELTLE